MNANLRMQNHRHRKYVGCFLVVKFYHKIGLIKYTTAGSMITAMGSTKTGGAWHDSFQRNRAESGFV